MRIVESELQRQQFFAKLEKRGFGALVLDYDGTLAPFRTDRDAAFPYPGVSQALSRIMAAGSTRVVLISGRPAEEVRSLLSVSPAPEIWGVHGIERLRADGSFDMVTLTESDKKVFSEAASWLELQGFSDLAERKSGSIAVHWRGMAVEDVDRIQGKVRTAWVPLAARGKMSLLEFDGGIELRLAGRDKGHAVLTVVEELEPGTPLAYLGDDVTDEDAFCALAGREALTVLVRPEWRATNAEVWIKPPAELLEFFQEWTQRCGGGG